ncbi:MAG: nickel pincer cofactor biosynthesis protein LarC [Coleofasciculus sp. B1-GNL1-01]|uniref:nickel pincer cofactor biosynthesis protein LarC n=1 Tax=Coleofasciculus sp. B1-GNL1-01 TaxID=3068484 RepID=UPI0032F16493
MPKLAYLDCQSGIAGDMCLGALVAAGVPLEYLSEKLKGLGIDQEYRLESESVHRQGQLATKVHVNLLTQTDHHDHAEPSDHEHSRHLADIEHLITTAGLPSQVVDWSLAIFRNLAEAEAEIHGMTPETVHFHEVGATDALVDIVGTCLGLDWLGIDRLYCSPLPTGGGTVQAAHGRLPVPVPAVLKLWESRQVPIYSNGIDRELVTPTGAAIAVTLATQFGPPPAMIIHKIGHGAGTSELAIPNILRLWIGEASELGIQFRGQEGTDSITDYPCQETVCVIETQIDDLNPQVIGYVFEVLFNAGALDVFTQAIGMKKSRPGILLTVICPPDRLTVCEDILFRETTTLGIRHFTQQRTILQREIQRVETKYGKVRVKVASRASGVQSAIANVQPEYEDCAAIARDYNLSWREVHQLALDAWYRANTPPLT